MIHLQVEDGYDGIYYTYDALDKDDAAKWLLEIALKHGPQDHGVYAPMKILRCIEDATR